jgi:hypothetical protein
VRLFRSPQRYLALFNRERAHRLNLDRLAGSANDFTKIRLVSPNSRFLRKILPRNGPAR